MLISYAFTPNSVFKSVPPNGSEPAWQTSMLYWDIVALIYVNETVCMVICSSTRFKSVVWWQGMNPLVLRLSQNAPYGWGAWCHSLSFKTFLSFINRLLSSVQFSSVAQSCPTLRDPMDCSPAGSSVHGVFQARALQRVPLPSPGLNWAVC